MGSWTESCVLSGLEIREGDEVYFAIMHPSKYHHDKMVADFTTAPIRGTYDDYGGITLLEDYAPLKLKEGDEYDGRVDNMIPLRIFVLAHIYDYVEKMRPYDSGDYARATSIMREHESIAHAVEGPMETIRKGLPYLDIQAHELEKQGWTNEDAHNFKNRFDYHFQPGETRPHFYCRGIFREHGEAFLPFFRRYLILTYAAGELRRQLTPWYIMYCYQYGGPDPMLGFYEHVVDTLKKRKAGMYED